MADTEIVENVTNVTSNDTLSGGALGRSAATPEGLLLAYVSLIVMALLPIWYGSFRSVAFNKKQKVSLVIFFEFYTFIHT